jgi:hypothetical protein
MDDVREHAGIEFDPAFAHCHIFGIEFDQDGVAAQAIGNETGRASAAEWIEHRAWHNIGIARTEWRPANSF